MHIVWISGCGGAYGVSFWDGEYEAGRGKSEYTHYKKPDYTTGVNVLKKTNL